MTFAHLVCRKPSDVISGIVEEYVRNRADPVSRFENLSIVPCACGFILLQFNNKNLSLQ